MKIQFFQAISTVKSNSVVRLGMLSVLTSVLSVTMVSTTFANPAPQPLPTSINSMYEVAQARQQVNTQGTFIAAEAPTTGSARIVTEGGHRYLEIDAAFSTTNQAPDLHVLLESAAVPPTTYSTFGSYVNLGKLRSNSGAQRYPIPDAINISQFRSVVIWCRMANATMGYATLGGSGRASIR